MENVFALIINARLVGVYSSHRKAVQAMIKETLSRGFVMTDYLYDFGIEFFTFSDPDNPTHKKEYELHEVELDSHV